ncbi:hypothetical protein IWW55_000170 [Coemansia sp. RSA 2706]|nr:hypothetical protein IWW55_000170 [Coemansia sp. RSA 2706]
MLFYYSLLLFGGLFCLQFWAVATALEPDNISDYLKDVKGGILVKDGKRTSCELGVIDNQSAVVSPICMGFTTTNRTQPGVNFEVYLDAGIDGKTAKYTVENITIHPGLNSSGLNNDIAVIKYNMAGANEWQNVVYPDFLYAAIDVIYVRRSLLDLDAIQWDTPQYSFDSYDVIYDDACRNASSLYDGGFDVIICGNHTMPTPLADLTPCRVPYGIAYVRIYNETFLLGTLNHASVWDVDTLCGNGMVFSYFMAYARYIRYIESVLGYSVRTDADRYSISPYGSDPNFTVRYPFHPDDPRLTIFDGDFYKDQKDPIVFPITESSSESPVESSTESLADSTASSGLSRGAKIAVGVCVSIGGLLIIGAAATYMFLRRKRQKARVVDTLRQQEIQEALVPNGGDAIVPAGIIAQSNEEDAQSAIEEPLPAYKPTDNDALRGSSDSSSQSRDMSL